MANIGDLSIQIEAIDNASKTLATISKNLQGFSNNVTKQTKTATAGFGGFSASAIRAGAAAGLGFVGIQSLAQGVKAMGAAMFESASNLEQNRVAFETMLGSAEQAKIMMQQISEFAQKTPFTLPEVQEGAKQLLAYNISAEKIIPTFEALGNIAAGVGKDKLPQLVLAYGQVRAATKLTSNELRQFTEAGVPLLEVLAKQTGKTAAQVKDDMENGAAPSFAEVEKAMFSLSQKGGKFENLIEKQSKTISGAWSNVQDAFTRIGAAILGVGADGEVATGSLYATMQEMTSSLVTWLGQNSKNIITWGTAIVSGFTLVVRTLWNVLQNGVEVIKAMFLSAGAFFVDMWTNVKEVMSGGGWSFENTELNKVWTDAAAGIDQNNQDIKDSFTNAMTSVDSAMASTGVNLGELKKTSDDTSGGIQATAAEAKAAAKEFESLGKKVKEANEKIKSENKDYKKDKSGLKDDYSKDLKEMETNLEKTLVKLESDFTAEMTKLRASYNSEMLKLNEDLQKDLAKIDEQYNKDNVSSQKDTNDSIAGVIVDKQTEIKDLQDQILKESSSEKRWELAQQIADIQSFLDKHKEDVVTYGAEIKAIQDFNNLDEIEQLKFKHDQEKIERDRAYAEEKAERITQYNEQVAEKTAQLATDIAEMQAEHVAKEAELHTEYEESRAKRKEEFKQDMEDLKDEHKDKLKELQKHLKEIKKELKDFVDSKEYKAASKYAGSSSAVSGSRAAGGPITQNKPYLVGERGPEMIIPAQSGRVIPTQNLQAATQSQGNGGTTTINVDIGMYAGAYSEKRKLGQEILDAINQTRKARGLGELA